MVYDEQPDLFFHPYTPPHIGTDFIPHQLDSHEQRNRFITYAASFYDNSITSFYNAETLRRQTSLQTIEQVVEDLIAMHYEQLIVIHDITDNTHMRISLTLTGRILAENMPLQRF